ncbi:hypothetical protein INT46_001195 [Mucor plumbeus]|uniref:Uncharacterized protein n=1 Tax=Mucor plumbeus TaxID=97098 RepID=A0A8H7R037_9FUNG|nr:hypothetical protein INT46_001195 [Mucor plumbeus]
MSFSKNQVVTVKGKLTSCSKVTDLEFPFPCHIVTVEQSTYNDRTVIRSKDTQIVVYGFLKYIIANFKDDEIILSDCPIKNLIAKLKKSTYTNM